MSLRHHKRRVHHAGVAALLVAASGAPLRADTIDTAGQAPWEPCGYCHEYDGNARMPGAPSLAGQHVPYLVKQLEDFRAARRTGTMQGTAELLSDADIAAVADYFNSQPLRPRPVDAMPAGELDVALRLYRFGDSDRELPACASCHGADARGLGRYPALRGQAPDYLGQELLRFKRGERRNDVGGIMSAVAAKLSAREIDLLAALLARMGQGVSG